MVTPYFFTFEPPNNNPQKVFMQLQRTSPFGSHTMKQVQEINEPNLP